MFNRSSTGVMSAAMLVLFMTTGCVEHALIETIRPHEVKLPPPGPPDVATDGAIWKGGTHSGSFLSYDRKARGVGDLLTVMILEDLSAAGSANTTLDGSSSSSANLTSDIGFTNALQQGAETLFDAIGVTGGGGNAPSGTTVNVLGSNRESAFEGDGETNRKSQFRGIVTCQIVESLPGGIYRVYGRRQILVNHELQLVTIQGLVRRQDIGLDNRVASSQIADARLTFDGVGVIDDKQRPSALSRMMDLLYPF
jgi:flagellar L-ring protein precursor FlgH